MFDGMPKNIGVTWLRPRQFLGTIIFAPDRLSQDEARPVRNLKS